MPKFPTYPILFDECRIISISDLRRWEYLKIDTTKSGTITWRNHYDEVTSSLSIQVVFNRTEQFVYLNYKCNDNPYYYKIHLTSIPSNLGIGKVWYFICPFTLKRCRKLHLLDEKFMHRSALSSGMYECQTKSKKWRGIERIYGAYFDLDKYYEQLYSKYFKTHYNGIPTKKYIKLMSFINRSESFNYDEIINLYLN